MNHLFSHLCLLILLAQLVGCEGASSRASDTTESGTTEFSTTQFSTTEPGTTESDTTDSSTTDSSTTEPGTTNSGGLFCVAEGSLVRTPDGQRLIEALAVGDHVLAYDIERATWVSAPLEAIRQNTEESIGLRVEGGELLIVTRSHPIYSPRLESYVPAQRWESNELSEVLRVASDGRATRAKVVVEAVEGTRRVFDLSVGSAQHNFVANGVLVHNKQSDVGSTSECDPWLQDCPDGEKCVPYGSTGGSWDANKCVPVMGDGQPDDPCTYGGTVDATDDCAQDSYCYNVQEVDGMMVGACTLFCTGSSDEPICEPGSACLITNQGSITLCLETCDPLLQECDAGLGCSWAQDDFLCVFTAEDIPLGEPCGSFNDCTPGTACLAAELMPNCEGSACCGSFCNLVEPSCPQEGTECTPFFEEAMVPPEHENVGICVLPVP